MTDDKAQPDKKNASNAKSSADNVEQHLQALENDGANKKLYYSQEQEFSSEEIANVINEARLNELLAQSDAFLNSLDGEIDDFGDDTDSINE